MYFNVNTCILMICVGLVTSCSLSRYITCKVIENCHARTLVVLADVYPPLPEALKVMMTRQRDRYGDLKPVALVTWQMYNGGYGNDSSDEGDTTSRPLHRDLQGIEEFRLRFTSLTKSPGKSRCVTFKLNYTSQLPPNIMFKFEYRFNAMPSRTYITNIDIFPRDLLSSTENNSVKFHTPDIVIYLPSSNWVSNNITVRTRPGKDIVLNVRFRLAPTIYRFKEYTIKLLNQNFQTLKQQIYTVIQKHARPGNLPVVRYFEHDYAHLNFTDICTGFYYLSVKPVSLYEMDPDKCVCKNSQNNCVKKCSATLSQMFHFNSSELCAFNEGFSNVTLAKIEVQQLKLQYTTTYTYLLAGVTVTIVMAVFAIVVTRYNREGKVNFESLEAYPFPNAADDIYASAVEFNNNKSWN